MGQGIGAKDGAIVKAVLLEVITVLDTQRISIEQT